MLKLDSSSQTSSPKNSSNSINHIKLQAVLIEKKALRYTPAGLPVQEILVSHQSQQGEAGVNRQIAFNCPALAYGAVAIKLSALPEQTLILFEGYLAPQYGMQSRWVLHIHYFDIEGRSEINEV
ncbi:MAG: primosomal replication protein N [Pseudomonadota bacterium]